MSKQEKSQPKTIVLLDSHAILHRAYHALPNFTSAKGEPTGALYGLALMLMSVIGEFKPDQIIAAFDLPEPTFRDEIYADYKGKRQKIEDDLIYQLNRAKDLVRAFDIEVVEHPGFEADDVLGTLVKKIKDKKVRIIVASGDMDTMSLLEDPRVRMYTLKTGIKDVVLYDAKKAEERYGFAPELIPDYKALRGDPSDNIIGVPGIGEKTATELVQKFGTLEQIYKKLKKNRQEFLDAGVKERIVKLLEDNEAEARFSLVLATIRKDAPVEVPPDDWQSRYRADKVKAMFEELGFKSLIARIPNLAVSALGAQVAPRAQGKTSLELGTPNGDDEVRLAQWVLDSNNLEPSGVGDLAKLEKEIHDKGLDRVYREMELPLIPILRKAEARGIKVDRKELKKLADAYHAKLALLTQKIYKDAGEEFNISSPKQLSQILFEKLALGGSKLKKTSTGQISTRAGELDKLKGSHPIVDSLLEYRELSKLLSTYIDVFPALLDSADKIHTHFVQWGSATGRLASHDPNMQNIPIKTEQGKAIRKIFVAEEGFTFASFDYSQIDLRSLALLSRDPKLLEFFAAGGDIHADVASALFKVPKDKVDKEMRRKAKVINFGIVYGMGVLALKANLGSTRAEAEEYLKNYFETFAGVRKYLDEVKAEARKEGFTQTFFGRRRYYPEINRGPEYMQAAAERQAANAPVQGTSADVIKLAMVEAERMIEKKGWKDKVHLLLQIHDELIYEISEEIASKAAAEIKTVMEGVVPEGQGGAKVAFPVHFSLGRSWGDL